MIEKRATELSFVAATKPLPTVELDSGSIPESFFGYDDLVANALSAFTASKPELRATVHVYHGMSVNFHEPTSSAFFGIAGPKSLLNVILNALQSVPGVRARLSDYIPPSSATPEFHLQDGLVWRPEDALTWYANPKNNPVKIEPLTTESPNESTVDDWEDEEDAAPEKSKNAIASRYRRARSDASVGSIKRTVEEVFGLPEGSVSLCGPDGKPLRADAKVGTLRKRWEQ